MEKIDRELLIKEISARLPYGVKVQVQGWDEEKGEVAIPLKVYSINTDGYISLEYNHYDVETVYVEDCRLYFRPMSSMTEEEIYEYNKLVELDRSDKESFNNLRIEYIQKHPEYKNMPFVPMHRHIDYLNSHHLDYRGLIPMGLALPAPDDMYKTQK